ncbi:hypothetical protein AB395_00006836 (plasmid) [Sinorhizobium fredii CCBAU 45436]|nr:hypothetical protein AB395_00006836 [Sinorhizobium fredii CCBAU 45436]
MPVAFVSGIINAPFFTTLYSAGILHTRLARLDDPHGFKEF